MTVHIEPLADPEAERRRIYALAEVVGRAWRALRARAPEHSAELEAALKSADHLDAHEHSDGLTVEHHLEGELVGILDELWTLYEVHDEITGAGPGRWVA